MSLWVLAREGAEVSRKAFVLSSILIQNGINLYSGKPTKKSQSQDSGWDFLDISVSVKSLLLWEHDNAHAVLADEVVEVNIPAGVSEGMIVNVPGKGNAGRHGGMNGDLQVVIEEAPHPTFVRDGNDLVYNLLLSVPQATLGDTVDIPTIDGMSKITIKPGTQPGKVLRLRGKGLPAVKGYGSGTGDLIVNVSVYIPENLTKEEKKAIETLKESENVKPNKDVKESIFQKFRALFD